MSSYSRNQKRNVGIGGLIMIVMIIIVFIFWGGNSGNRGSSGSSVVAKVNGAPILRAEFQKRLLQRIEMFESQLNQSITPQLLQQLKIPDQVLTQMINELLIKQEAKHFGLIVSNQELTEVITSAPTFQDDKGIFSVNRYKGQLARYGLTPADYEGEVRDQLLSSKLTSLIGDAIVTSKEEVLLDFALRNDQRDLEVVKIDTADLVDRFPILPSDINDFIKSHDTEITNYFETHPDEFNKPESVKVKQIVMEIPSNNKTPEKEKEIKEKLEKLKKEATVANFSTLSKQNSTGPYAAKSGDLGWITRDMMVKEISDVAFSLNAGTISNVFKSPMGYHLILVEDKKVAVNKPIETVRDEIAEKLFKETRAEEKAKNLALLVMDAWKNGKSINQLLSPHNIKPSTTGYFSRTTTFIPQIGKSDEALATAFSLSKSRPFPTGPLYVNGSWIVMKFNDAKGANDVDFAKQESALIKDSIKSKTNEAYKLLFADMQNKAKIDRKPFEIDSNQPQ